MVGRARTQFYDRLFTQLGLVPNCEANVFIIPSIVFARVFVCCIKAFKYMDSLLKCPNCMIGITTTFDLQNSRTGSMGVLSLECQ